MVLDSTCSAQVLRSILCVASRQACKCGRIGSLGRQGQSTRPKAEAFRTRAHFPCLLGPSRLLRRETLACPPDTACAHTCLGAHAMPRFLPLPREAPCLTSLTVRRCPPRAWMRPQVSGQPLGSLCLLRLQFSRHWRPMTWSEPQASD